MLLDLQKASNDSLRYVGNMKLGYYYQELNRDSSLFYYSKALEFSQNNNQKYAQASALTMTGYQLIAKEDYADALQNLLNAFSIIEETKNEKNSWFYFPGSSNIKDKRTYVLSLTQQVYSVLMNNTGNSEQEIFYLREALKNGKKMNDPYRIGLPYMNLGYVFIKLNKLDSALFFETEALRYLNEAVSIKYLCNVLTWIGEIYSKKGNKELAKQYYLASIQSAIEQDNVGTITGSYYGLSKYYQSEGVRDSGIYYAIKSLESIQLAAYTRPGDLSKGDLYENLSHCYELNKQIDSTLKYQRLALISKDSFYRERINNLKSFQNLNFNEQLRLRDIEKNRLAYQNKVRTYSFLGGLAVFSLIAFILYRNNRQKQKANRVLETTLDNLKSTQSQLIQSEKMASLGELTAGIAHEIQNPLNFVNNFSEVSNELIDELNEELDKGEIEEARTISTDIKQNLEKINHHGKRADAIVKGMLQHSRTSTGQKELTDINALADEYLRLAYHGMLAKDKSFKADFKTEFDEKLPKINVIPQDIGRVLLNLINNAFYAAPLPSRSESGTGSEGGFKEPNYVHRPMVTVKTSYLPPSGGMRGAVVISVSDNGPGIPSSIVDKIFQPFFTTKPTGQGTGLGLSLAYDIVKAHGGELKVETQPGEYTKFTVQLPFNTNDI